MCVATGKGNIFFWKIHDMNSDCNNFVLFYLAHLKLFKDFSWVVNWEKNFALLRGQGKLAK